MSLLLARIAQAHRSSGPPPVATRIFLKCDGPNNSTTFNDEDGGTWTANGDAKITTSSPLSGSGSLIMADGSGYLSRAYSSGYALGSANFKVSAKVRFSSLPNAGGASNQIAATIIGQWNDSSTLSNLGWYFYYYSSGLYLSYSTTGGNQIDKSAAWTAVVDTTYLIELERIGSSLIFRVDGTQVGSTVSMTDTIYASTKKLSIGGLLYGPNRYPFIGKMDDVKLI